jgi:hypothetical protein
MRALHSGQLPSVSHHTPYVSLKIRELALLIRRVVLENRPTLESNRGLSHGNKAAGKITENPYEWRKASGYADFKVDVVELGSHLTEVLSRPRTTDYKKSQQTTSYQE